MKTEILKPARAGLVVRDPITGSPLPEDGAEKPKNSFWTRRLRDGDVEIVKQSRKKTSKTTKSTDESTEG